ncbi:MAG: efflux RND transporter periplasmic adaptor subunit [Bacteroidota bacterium]|nr:efflux RND transporter periplasmic adaptor subunit [Bacteroidota bacterium]
MKVISTQRLLIILSALLTLAGCTQENTDTDEAPVAVRVTQPIRTDLALRLPYLATVHAKTEIQIIAQIQGTVAAIAREEGERVRKGELLLQLDAPELEEAVQRLRSERDYWCSRSKTDERLLEQGAVSEDNVEAGRRACANAEAALREATARLRKSAEHASMNGTLLRRLVETGQHVMPGQPLLLLGDDVAELRVDVIEGDMQRGIVVGTPVQVHTGEDEILRAAVREVAASSKMPMRTFTVRIGLQDARRLQHRNGVSLPVDFILREAQEALALPSSAVADPDKDPHVFLVRDDTVIRQNVEVGIQDGTLLEVRFPWNGRDDVAVSNLQKLRDSLRVLPVEVGEVRK